MDFANPKRYNHALHNTYDDHLDQVIPEIVAVESGHGVFVRWEDYEALRKHCADTWECLQRAERNQREEKWVSTGDEY